MIMMLTFLQPILASSGCVVSASSLKQCRAMNHFISVRCSLETSLSKKIASTDQTLSNIDQYLQAHKLNLFDTHPFPISDSLLVVLIFAWSLQMSSSRVDKNDTCRILHCELSSKIPRRLSCPFAGKYCSVLGCNFTIGA